MVYHDSSVFTEITFDQVNFYYPSRPDEHILKVSSNDSQTESSSVHKYTVIGQRVN